LLNCLFITYNYVYICFLLTNKTDIMKPKKTKEELNRLSLRKYNKRYCDLTFTEFTFLLN